MYLDSRKDEASSMETRNSGSGKKKMNRDTEELSVKGSDGIRREPADQTMIKGKSFATGVWFVIILEQCQRWRICNIRGCKEKHCWLLHKDEEKKTDGFAGTTLSAVQQGQHRVAC